MAMKLRSRFLKGCAQNRLSFIRCAFDLIPRELAGAPSLPAFQLVSMQRNTCPPSPQSTVTHFPEGTTTDAALVETYAEIVRTAGAECMAAQAALCHAGCSCWQTHAGGHTAATAVYRYAAELCVQSETAFLKQNVHECDSR
jgi:hypothetical protein